MPEMQCSKIYDNYNQDKKECHMTCEYIAKGKPFGGYAGLHGWSLYHFAELQSHMRPHKVVIHH